MTTHLHVTGTRADSITFVVRDSSFERAEVHELDAEMIAHVLKTTLPSKTFTALVRRMRGGEYGA